MKNKEAYSYSIMKYGLTDNMELMVLDLIERIKLNLVSIKEKKRRLKLLKYLYANVSLSYLDYKQEREDTLNYLKAFSSIDYSKIIEQIEKMNSKTFFYFNKEDKYIKTETVEVISMDDLNVDYSYAVNYKDINDNNSFYMLPINNKTTKISRDSKLKKIITSKLDEYNELIELNNLYNDIKEIKEQLNIKKTKHEEEKYKNLVIEYKRKKEKIKTIIDGNEGLLELVKTKYISKYGETNNMSYHKLLPILIEVYKSTILPNMLKDASNYLDEKNNESKEFCECILTSLNSEIVSLDCSINSESELYDYQFILDILDNIYPGIKLELSDSLRNSDKDKMNSIIDTIEQVLYLDDTEKVLVK